MNYAVLCEGETDAILIGYFIIKKYGWAHRDKIDGMTPKAKEKKGESAEWYSKGDNNLLICGVGGCSKFASFFDDYIAPIQTMDYQDDMSFSKIVIIRDRDYSTILEIENDINKNIHSMSISFKNNKWTTNQYNAKFSNKSASFDSYLLVIPENQNGALETVVLQAISEDPNDKCIVDASCDFVDQIKDKAQKYIINNRYVSKAKLGVTFAIMSPMKVFQFINNLLLSIKWEEKQTIIDLFSVLAEL